MIHVIETIKRHGQHVADILYSHEDPKAGPEDHWDIAGIRFYDHTPSRISIWLTIGELDEEIWANAEEIK